MKKMIFIVAILFCISLSANAQDPNIIKELQDAVDQLDLQITNLLKIIELQKSEIAHLKKLCQDGGINTAPPPAGISKPIFGIYLGEELESLQSRLKTSISNYTFADKNFRGSVYNVECNDPNIKEVLVYVFNRRIYEIDVEFADANATNCRAIEEFLKRNYQHIYRNTFETMIDGVNIGIELNCTTLPDKNRIVLSYIHVPILTEIYAEVGRAKVKIVQ